MSKWSKIIAVVAFLSLTGTSLAVEPVSKITRCQPNQYLVPVTYYDNAGKRPKKVKTNKCVGKANHAILKAEIVKEYDRVKVGGHNLDINYRNFLDATIAKEWTNRGKPAVDLKKIVLAAEIVPSFKERIKKYFIDLLR